MTKLILVLTLLFIIKGKLFAQNEFDCKQLLNKEITEINLQDKLESFISDLEQLMHCEMDSIDFRIFNGPQGLYPIAASYILGQSNKESENETPFTFRDLRDILIKLKNSEDYLKVRTMVEATNKLDINQASLSNWKQDRVLLKKMGLEDMQIEEIHAIVEEHDNLITYREVFEIFKNALEERVEIEKAKKQIIREQMQLEHPDMVEGAYGLWVYMDYQKGINKSKQLNKPALIYFTGKACVNARKMEYSILSDPQIQQFMNDHFIQIHLYTDLRKALAENEVYYSETLQKEIRTEGHKNQDFQKRDFQSSKQPYFVILTPEGNNLANIDYTESVEEFMKFLKKR